LLIIDSQAVKNTDTADKDTKGFCIYKCTNGIKRHLCVDTLGLPIFIYCSPANMTDDQGLVDMLIINSEWFVQLPKGWFIKVLLDNGYHLEKIKKGLANYPNILDHIDLEITDKPTKVTDNPGFKPVHKRWVVERTNAWTEKYRVLWKNCEGKLKTSEAKLSLRFTRLILARLVKN
jgi:transposase